MSKIKLVTYDFIVDSFVTVDAPIGTDPESLVEQALNKFVRLMTTNDLELTFDTIFDPESGAYDEDWENYGNIKESDKDEKCDRCGKVDDDSETYYIANNPEELLCKSCAVQP